MNRELVEILIGIYQTDEIYKSTLCNRVSSPLRRGEFKVYPFDYMKICNSRCDVCPIEYMHISYFGRPHYLMHLIALMDKGNI